MKTLALLLFLEGPAIGAWLYWSADQKVQLAERQRNEAAQRIAKPAADVLINGGDLNSLLDEVRPYKEALDRAEADRKSSMYLGLGAAALGLILGFSCQSAASKRNVSP